MRLTKRRNIMITLIEQSTHAINLQYTQSLNFLVSNKRASMQVYSMEETDMETVSRKEMKPASRYKKWLEGGGGAGFMAETGSRYKKWLEGGGGAGFMAETASWYKRWLEGGGGAGFMAETASRYKKWLEGGGRAGFGWVYFAKWGRTLVF